MPSNQYFGLINLHLSQFDWFQYLESSIYCDLYFKIKSMLGKCYHLYIFDLSFRMDCECFLQKLNVIYSHQSTSLLHPSSFFQWVIKEQFQELALVYLDLITFKIFNWNLIRLHAFSDSPLFMSAQLPDLFPVQIFSTSNPLSNQYCFKLLYLFADSIIQEVFYSSFRIKLLFLLNHLFDFLLIKQSFQNIPIFFIILQYRHISNLNS